MVSAFGSTQPFHSHFHQTFTSTLTPGFNVWPVIVTAAFFFTVLSWYNTFLALYEYYFQQNQEQEVLQDNLLTLTVFALIWSLIAVLLYLWLNGMGILTNKSSENGDISRPSSNPSDLVSEALSPI